MKIHNPEQTKKRRLQIIEAAAKAFASTGFHQTNMRQIADSAGFSVGNLYRYFSNKEELIVAFIESQNDELEEGFQWLSSSKNYKKSLIQFLEACLKEYKDRNYAALMAEIYSESFRNDKVREILETLEKNNQNLMMKSLSTAQLNKLVELPLGLDMTCELLLGILDGLGPRIQVSKELTYRKASRSLKELIGQLIH